MCGFGTWELLIVLAVVLLLFGASRLPQLGKALGETIRNFKKGISSSQEESQETSTAALPEGNKSKECRSQKPLSLEEDNSVQEKDTPKES